MKHFGQHRHGYQSLWSAHQSMLKTGNYINEVQKQKENAERVLDLQNNTTGWSGKNVRQGCCCFVVVLLFCCCFVLNNKFLCVIMLMLISFHGVGNSNSIP